MSMKGTIACKKLFLKHPQDHRRVKVKPFCSFISSDSNRVELYDLLFKIILLYLIPGLSSINQSMFRTSVLCCKSKAMTENKEKQTWALKGHRRSRSSVRTADLVELQSWLFTCDLPNKHHTPQIHHYFIKLYTCSAFPVSFYHFAVKNSVSCSCKHDGRRHRSGGSPWDASGCYCRAHSQPEPVNGRKTKQWSRSCSTAVLMQHLSLKSI